MCCTTWQCPCNVTHKLFFLFFYQHPFIADVVDNKPLKELYNEAKAVVIEEFEDLPEDTEVPFICVCFSSNAFLDKGLYSKLENTGCMTTFNLFDKS